MNSIPAEMHYKYMQYLTISDLGNLTRTSGQVGACARVAIDKLIESSFESIMAQIYSTESDFVLFKIYAHALHLKDISSRNSTLEKVAEIFSAKFRFAGAFKAIEHITTPDSRDRILRRLFHDILIQDGYQECLVTILEIENSVIRDVNLVRLTREFTKKGYIQEALDVWVHINKDPQIVLIDMTCLLANTGNEEKAVEFAKRLPNSVQGLAYELLNQIFTNRGRTDLLKLLIGSATLFL